jgi:hypothetical protein
MRTSGRRQGQVIQRNKSAPQPLGRRWTGRLCLLAGLCLLVLAVMPVAAQAATQHWYVNGNIDPAGTETAVVMFGEEANVAELIPGEINCRTVDGGMIENPVGGGAGVGRTNSSDFYECKQPYCEEEVKKRFGVAGRATLTTENNPAATKESAFPGWTNLLEESAVAGTNSVREKIGEPFVTTKTPSPPGMMRQTTSCEIASTKAVAFAFIYEGEYKPEIGVAKVGNLNGVMAAKPSKVHFEGAGTGALHSQEGGEPGTATGNLKYLGYNEQELITVKP